MEACHSSIDYNANPLQSNTQYIPVPREQIKKSVESGKSHNDCCLLDIDTSFSPNNLKDDMSTENVFKSNQESGMHLSSVSESQYPIINSAKELNVLNLVLVDKYSSGEMSKCPLLYSNDSLKPGYLHLKGIFNQENTLHPEENRMAIKDYSTLSEHISKKENVITHAENASLQEDIFYALNQFDWAAQTIQSYWRSYRICQKNIKVLNVRNEIRNRRLEDHLLYLLYETKRFHQLYEQEKCLRMLQMEAIRSLWKEMKMLLSWKNEIMKTNGFPSKETELESQSKRHGK